MNDLHYAVVVGIDRYPALRDLRAARGDADRFAEWLRDPNGGGLPKANVTPITPFIASDADLKAAKPIYDEVFDALDGYRLQVKKHVKANRADWPRTRLYFYVAGHGVAPSSEDAALLMANATADHYGRNVSCAEIRKYFATAQMFSELVILADCCREYVDGARPNAPDWTEEKPPGREVNQATCYATYFGDYSYEPTPAEVANPDDCRGYFTKALLEGLNGEAVDDRLRRIDTTSLGAYVRPRVETLTRHRKRVQRATFNADTGKPIVFRTGVAPAPPHRVTIQLSAPGGLVALLDGGLQVVGRHDTTKGPWALDLPNGLYEIRPDGLPAGAPNPLGESARFDVWGEDRHVTV